MRALRFHQARELGVEKVPEPGPPGPGEVLLRPVMCGICGTDLHEYTDGPIVTPARPHPLTGAELPQILGHEFSAVVAATGPGVSHVGEGDLCTVMPLISCGHCHECVRGLGHLCRTMACTGLSSAWGGLADLAIVSAAQVVPAADTHDPAAGGAHRAGRGRRVRRGPRAAPARSDRPDHGGGPDRIVGCPVCARGRGPPGGDLRAGSVAAGPGRHPGRGPGGGDHRRPGRRAGHRGDRRAHRAGSGPTWRSNAPATRAR